MSYATLGLAALGTHPLLELLAPFSLQHFNLLDKL